MAGNIFISHSPGLIWTAKPVTGSSSVSWRTEARMKSAAGKRLTFFLPGTWLEVFFLSESQLKMEGWSPKFLSRNRFLGLFYPRDSPAPRVLTDNPDRVFRELNLPAFDSQGRHFPPRESSFTIPSAFPQPQPGSAPALKPRGRHCLASGLLCSWVLGAPRPVSPHR